jgi:hypothetical protein
MENRCELCELPLISGQSSLHPLGVKTLLPVGIDFTTTIYLPVFPHVRKSFRCPNSCKNILTIVGYLTEQPMPNSHRKERVVMSIELDQPAYTKVEKWNARFGLPRKEIVSRMVAYFTIWDETMVAFALDILPVQVMASDDIWEAEVAKMLKQLEHLRRDRIARHSHNHHNHGGT